MDGWLPIETKPVATHCQERGEYRSDDGLLWYFKPTHWRPITPDLPEQSQQSDGARTMVNIESLGFVAEKLRAEEAPYKAAGDPRGLVVGAMAFCVEEAISEIERMRAALDAILAKQALTFAECADAEEIMRIAKEARQ